MSATNPLTIRRNRLLHPRRARQDPRRGAKPRVRRPRPAPDGARRTCADRWCDVFARRAQGVVLGTPQAGDELVIRYVPEPEIRTSLRFDLQPLNVA